MEPFFFGPTHAQLFGVFHPASTNAPGGTGVVLCHPLGQEYMRSHRAFLQLAIRLAAAGAPTLRFDFHGCGDSPGGSESATLARWSEDVGVALDELAGGCEITDACLCGLRLGAAMATRAARTRGDCDRLVLWDPVVDGREYLDELSVQHEEWLRGSFAVAHTAPAVGAVERLGFPIEAASLGEIGELDLLALDARPAGRILIVESQRREATQRLAQHLRSLGADVTSRHAPGPPVWRKLATDEAAEFGDGLVPSELLNTIVSWIGRPIDA